MMGAAFEPITPLLHHSIFSFAFEAALRHLPRPLARRRAR